jgi:HEAT repeat protein
MAAHAAPLPPLERASWIWAQESDACCNLRRVFLLEATPTNASVLITADNGYELHVNGSLVGSDVGAASEVWQSVERYDITSRLVKGRNILGIQGLDLGGVRGVVAAVRVEVKDKPPLELVTDETWRVTREGQAVDYSHPEFVEGPEWMDAKRVGPMGMAPWGRVAWSEAGARTRAKSLAASRVELAAPGKDFAWPEAVAFLGEDCSVYVPLRADAWGVAFRVGDWSRAYTEFDLPCPSKIGRKLFVVDFKQATDAQERPDGSVVPNGSPSPLNGERAGVRGGNVVARSKLENDRAEPPLTLALSPLRGEGTGSVSDRPTPRLLCDAGAGAIGSPSVTFDGRALLIAAALGGEKFFHIYRVPADGGAPQRLTDGPFHDLDPAELPDGRIVFTSTRIGTFEEYHQPPSRALFRMNADGSDIHLITATPIFDNEPKVMANGRVAFIRTDNFFDRGKVETHLHSVRPDGTDGLAEFAANVGPDYGSRLRAFGFGSPAPLPDGRLAYISSHGNFIGASGSPQREQHRLPGQLGDLAPLPDGRLLCTVLRPDGKRMTSDVLGVIDPRDNRIVSLFESKAGGIHSPVFLGARARPPVIPDYVDRARADRSGATGFLFCQDARFTTKSKADWERIRAIRVLGAVPLTTRSSHSHIVHVGHETVELGTVPLAPDGSFSLEVPADMPLALQAVDAEGRSELNEMSWLYVRPGERRSCIGCHQPREAAPSFTGSTADALSAPPVKLLGQGDPHRSRGNNPGVTGMMDLQFERFRECASLNRNVLRDPPNASRRDELAALVRQLGGADDGQKISAAQRLALLREHEAAPALAGALKESGREARLAAALALAACGTRESIQPLLGALDDKDPVVVQAANVALENLTAHSEPSSAAARWKAWLGSNSCDDMEQGLVAALNASTKRTNTLLIAERWNEGSRGLQPTVSTSETSRVAERRMSSSNAGHDSISNVAPRQASNQTALPWAEAHGYPQGLAPRGVGSVDPWSPRVLQHRSIVALGHIGGDAARAALRKIVRTEAARNPYPPFVNDNRTDNFTFAAASPLNPRTLQEAVRALGQLRDTNALPLLSELLAKNLEPRTGNLFLAEAIIESLGRIGSPGAEATLIETFAALKDYWHYVGWYSDHPALYACHSSPVHARIIEALDALGSTRAAGIVPQLIRSVPTDPDRGLFLQNDDYETLVGRLIRRSGRGGEVVEACLALLGDPVAAGVPPAVEPERLARRGSSADLDHGGLSNPSVRAAGRTPSTAGGTPAATDDLKAALSTTHPAWGGHPGPENRSAQILSLTCRDTAAEPRIRAAFARFRALPEEPINRTLGNPTWTPVRHWTLFYLARALGNLRDRASVNTLAAVLSDDLNEARHGRPDPSQPLIHLLHLDYTPCWRAAAAWALGEIGDRRARPALLGGVRNLDNATDVRHAAATALGKVAVPSDLAELNKLAVDYPEVSVRKVLQAACARIGGTEGGGAKLARRNGGQ